MGFPLLNNKHFENPISTDELGLIVIICLFFKSLFIYTEVELPLYILGDCLYWPSNLSGSSWGLNASLRPPKVRQS